MRHSRKVDRLVLYLGCLLLLSASIHAEQLPIKTYTTADGLAQDNINRIVRDGRGFLWFCTAEGLSRFDGYEFTNYTTDQGLPHRSVTDLLEARDGSYWVATGGGISRLNPVGAPLFTNYRPGPDEKSWSVQVVIQDRDGRIWCGTSGGVYLLNPSSSQPQFEFVDMGMPSDGEGQVVQAMVADSNGSLWVGTRGSGLYHRGPQGQVVHYSTREGLPSNRVETLLQDRDGHVWVGTPAGLVEVNGSRGQPLAEHVYSTKDGLPSNWIEEIYQTADGKFWLSTDVGLSEFDPSAKKDSYFKNYSTANGLSSNYVTAIAEDRDRNLWLGTDSGGAMKIARTGFTNFTEADGLGSAGVDAVFENRSGELFAISSFHKHFINQFDGRRFKAVWPDVPAQIKNPGWGSNQVTFEDHTGQWWIPTGDGLCRFPAVKRMEDLAYTRPIAIYSTRNGLPYDDVFRLYEDSRGDVWISTLSPLNNGLSRWDRATNSLHTYSEADGLPSLRMNPATAFAQGPAGEVWIGLLGGGLLRYQDGRFSLFTTADGLPAGTIRSLYVDSAHRLWLASALGGLGRVDQPGAQRPNFVLYTTAQGLSSNDVWCVTEDNFGQIYVGTGRGLDRLDPLSLHIKHYRTADGLLLGKITSSFRDHHGSLWFASNVHGLSRFTPEAEPPESAPEILITGLKVAGVIRQISQLGETDIGRIELGSSQNQLNIDFVGLSFGPGEQLRYQYQLEGSEQSWSQPSDHRSVNYASLAAGRYRFLVRAVNSEGVASIRPATFAFTILPPFWERWWFILLATVLLGLTAYTIHRQRLAQSVALERVRTRIATDLHDDIGANLSLIAMLSDVARTQLERDDVRLREWFSTIATTSRDTVDAMSDIVWAVNPKRDQLRDLTRRMRRFADDILGARNIELSFAAPDSDLKLGSDLRRSLFLIFKEAVNNIVRHSRCTSVTVHLSVEHGWLVLKVSDNGKGIDSSSSIEGVGLGSMVQRAQELGGTLNVLSPNGTGTTLTLKLPLERTIKL